MHPFPGSSALQSNLHLKENNPAGGGDSGSDSDSNLSMVDLLEIVRRLEIPLRPGIYGVDRDPNMADINDLDDQADTASEQDSDSEGDTQSMQIEQDEQHDPTDRNDGSDDDELDNDDDDDTDHQNPQNEMEEFKNNLEHFLTLEAVDEFQIPGSDEIVYVDDIVALQTDDPGDWLARVNDIRVEPADGDDEPEILVKIHWFYSGVHVRGSIKDHGWKPKHLTFDPNCCAEHELIETPDHQEIYSASLVKEKREVICFRNAEERDVNQQPIPEGTPWSRTKYYLHQLKTAKCQAVPINLCDCAKSPRKPRFRANDRVIQRFCPQLGCRRWLHRECLAKKPHGRITHDVQQKLLDNTPDFATMEIQHLLLVDMATLPPAQLVGSLRTIASQPIERDNDHPFGNRYEVCLARTLLQKSVAEEPVDWDAVCRMEIFKQPLPQTGSETMKECFHCTFCGKAV